MSAQKSWLLTSMSKPHEIEQAGKSGADVVVLDLVELLTEKNKPAARAAVRAAIDTVRADGAEVFVQIDPAVCDADLRASVWPGLSGVVVSRAESVAQLQAVDKYLFFLEKERGMASGATSLVVSLDTARGNYDAYDIINASKRVCAATLGRADLVMDLRPEPSGELHLLPYLMQRLVIIARASGVIPLGAWWRAPDRGLLATPQNTHNAAQRGRAIGFKGAMCLRANQVDALNRAFA